MKVARDPIDEPDTNGAHLLGQHLGLRLDHHAMVRPHKLMPLDQHRLPLPRSLRVQTMLVDVGGDDGLGLNVDKVLPRVRVDAHGEVRVRVDVPETAAKERWAAVARAPGREAGALDLRSVARQLRRDGAVEVGVGWCGGRRGHEVEVGAREAARLGVGEDLAVVDGGGVVEGDEGEGRVGDAEAFLVDGWKWVREVIYDRGSQQIQDITYSRETLEFIETTAHEALGQQTWCGPHSDGGSVLNLQYFRVRLCPVLISFEYPLGYVSVLVSLYFV